MSRYILEEYGKELQGVIDKVQQLVADGGEGATLFTAEDRETLETIKKRAIKYGSTAYWREQIGFIPAAGEIVIYSDYFVYNDGDRPVVVPGIKVGSGNAFLADLSFIDQKVAFDLLQHIADTDKHVTEEDRKRWNNKLNIEDEVEDENLVFNRE